MVKWNGNGFNSKISHHEAKELSEIVMKRITYVPKELGADWRDIPNKEWKMSNGRVTPKLKYPYISAKTGKPAGIVSLSLLHMINLKKKCLQRKNLEEIQDQIAICAKSEIKVQKRNKSLKKK